MSTLVSASSSGKRLPEPLIAAVYTGPGVTSRYPAQGACQPMQSALSPTPLPTAPREKAPILVLQVWGWRLYPARPLHRPRSVTQPAAVTIPALAVLPPTPANQPICPAFWRLLSQQNLLASSSLPDTVPNEVFNLPHVHGFFASEQQASSRSSASTGCPFPQLPYPAVPLGERLLPLETLPKIQHSYYLRLFWDACHPLLQIMGELEFAELDPLPPPAILHEYSATNALVDCILSLGIQHSHITGLSGHILGLQAVAFSAV
ncbi:uncharacterized protein N7503_006153 [Penicillium pulvis]|uniref:uncharacterized protein n=1 Tax=Penicillium pulvis TaxID=1562058 RepID=UPI002547E965|nr:uncharacterized protein N7503_006153 [Penicillium pulvis]KAJ5798648.1 hypothetical protein N7503_006153 [Penicillium pulvis]